MMLLGRRQVVSPGATVAAPDGRAEELREAAVRGDSDTVVRLASDGVKFEPDEAGRTAMHLACSAGHANVVASLILNGADVNKPDEAGCSPLQRAAAEGHLEVVRQLLRHGADVNHQDEVHGNTALHEASWKGFSRCVTALTRAKAIDMTLKNRGGFAALHLCCQNGHNQSCRELLLNGCSADLQNNYGDTPLHTSARYGHAGVTRILISAKCRVSDQNKNGDTALHIAAAMGRRKLTRILLEAGCDKSLKNKQGETARDIATRKDLTEILAILNVPAASASSPTDKRASRRGKKSSRTDPTSKKREKTESGTSSKDSSTRHKEKKKAKQNGTGKVHFEKMKMKMADGGKQWSPYGCHYYPDPQAFPQPNLDSLPHEPLKRGEQYYLDLAGNICKGPVGVGYTCYCAPFFKNMEARLDRDKQELKEHIDAAHARLDEKVSSLERRTHGRIEELSRSVAAERAECTERHAHLTHWLHGELSRGGAYRASERVPQRVERQPSILRARSLEDLLDERPRRSRAPAVLTHNGSVNDILESCWPDNSEFRPVNAADSSRWEQDDDDGASSESSEGEGEDQNHDGLELGPKNNNNEIEYHGKTPDYENLTAYKEQWIRDQKSWSPDEDRWRMDDTGKWIRQESYNERWTRRRDYVAENESSCRSWSREDHRNETHDARLLVASLGLRSRTAVYSNGASPATDATADTPNDSGYSTKVYGSSKGPSPELPEGYAAGQLPYPPRLNGMQPGGQSAIPHNKAVMPQPQRRNIGNASLV